jgi:tetratricopeptide (TPR) repeat protein
MTNSSQTLTFQSAKTAVLYALFFLFPLFFLPTTQEFFVTNKFYLLGFGALALLMISTLELMITKKLVWRKGMFDNAAILFLLTLGLSTLFVSPNKVQALLNANLSVTAVFALIVLYFYASRNQEVNRKFKPLAILNFSALILAVLSIVYFFQPLKDAALPTALAFLKNPSFTPIGNQLDLVVFLGFFLVYNVATFINARDHGGEARRKSYPAALLSIAVLSLALLLTGYSVVRPAAAQSSLLQNLPPFSISWYSAVEVLKNPLTALFGAGVDNFASIFTLGKDLAYNQSALWEVSSFNASRSAFLHIFTEAGLVGFVAFVLLILGMMREIGKERNAHEHLHPLFFAAGFTVLALLLLPISLVTLFLLFVVLAALGHHTASTGNHEPRHNASMDLGNLLPVYLGAVMFALAFLGITGYLLGTAYAAEYAFKQSLNGIVNNNLKELYDNQRQAVLTNQHIERYRVNFSQTNLLIANNVAARANTAPAAEGQQETQPQLSEEDRQTIAQAIQAAISEAKAAVALNPQKSTNWENLANIYRNLLNVAQGADAWTISSYQRAIVLDPQNPLYRLNLGGIYYSMNSFDEASKLFEQAVALKNDWPNAHYNLAWASYQRADYQRAVNEMQSVLTLLDAKQDAADLKRAQTELEEFKKKLPQDTQSATGEGQPQQLSLPTPQGATVEPKVQVPEGAPPTE